MRSTPVKYFGWISPAPEKNYEHVSHDGNPMVVLAAIVAVLGALFGLIALVG